MNVFNIEATVHKELSLGYRVKVSILDLGLYINGMVVFPPNEEHEHWAVYPPSMRAGRGKYAYITEFNKKLPLWDEVFDACVDAVKIRQSDDKDVVIADFDENAPITIGDIPF
jgi:hypothetical protein